MRKSFLKEIERLKKEIGESQERTLVGIVENASEHECLVHKAIQEGFSCVVAIRIYEETKGN